MKSDEKSYILTCANLTRTVTTTEFCQNYYQISMIYATFFAAKQRHDYFSSEHRLQEITNA